MYWKDQKGFIHHTEKMSNEHILNCIKSIKGSGRNILPDPYCGVSHKYWITTFEKELKKRNFKKIYECW